MTRNIYEGLRYLSITQGFFSILNKEGKYATEIFNGKERNIVNKKARISFGYKTQEDASEFLVKIMQDLLPNINTPIVQELLNSFKYEEKSIVTCKYTNEQFTKQITSFNLDIPIIYNNLTQNLQAFLAEEIIDSENDYLESCISEANPTGIIQNKRLQIEFTENTTNLIIKLKRFTSSNRKINTHITPEVILDFNTIDLEHPQDVLFILQGCIIHLGSTMRSGHYVYLVFDDSGKPQFIMSDSSITDVDDTYLTDGYIYYYRRITR